MDSSSASRDHQLFDISAWFEVAQDLVGCEGVEPDLLGDIGSGEGRLVLSGADLGESHGRTSRIRSMRTRMLPPHGPGTVTVSRFTRMTPMNGS